MNKSLILSFLIAASIYGVCNAENRILTAQLTKGPYEVVADETDAYQKANITSLQDGLPIKYILTVVRDNKTIPNIRLDTWFANAAGKYSGVASDGTGDQDFLRGWQVTDENGQATFYGIFPGTYTGRTVHVHIRAREYATNGTIIYNNTTQLFFPEEIITEVLKLDYYKDGAAKGHNTDNDHDMFYTTENMLTLTGDTTTGYLATATIEIPLRNTNQSSADSEFGGQGGQGGRGRPGQNDTMGPNGQGGQGQFGGRNNSMGPNGQGGQGQFGGRNNSIGPNGQGGQGQFGGRNNSMGPNGQGGQGQFGGRNNSMGPNGQGQFGGPNGTMGPNGQFGGPNGTMGSANPNSTSEVGTGSSYALIYFLGGLIVGGLFYAIIQKRRTKKLQSLINQEDSHDPIIAQEYRGL